MPAHASNDIEAPAIEAVEHNVAGIDRTFAGVDPVESEYVENFAHSGDSVRFVLDNGNWIEYHRLDDDTIVECAFVQRDSDDGDTELVLENRLKLRNRSVGTTAAFFETVDASIEVYQREVGTVADAAEMWDNIVPAVEG